MVRRTLILLAILVGTPVMASGARAQSTVTVSPALVSAVDQAAASGNNAALGSAAQAVIAAANGDPAALRAAVAKAVAGASDPSQVPAIVTAFMDHGLAFVSDIVAGAVQGNPALAPQIAAAAAAADPTDAVAIDIAAVQALPPEQQTPAMKQAIVASIQQVDPQFSTAALGQVNTPGPTARPTISSTAVAGPAQSPVN